MLRHILLGIGIACIAISLILVGIDFKSVEAPVISEKMIINKAKNLGMAFPGEDYKKGISLDKEVDLSKSLVSFNRVSEKKKNKTEENKMEEEVIIEKAEKLGMIFPKKDRKESVVIKDINFDYIPPSFFSTKNQDEKDKEEVKEKEDIKEEIIKVFIPTGVSSSEVADLLKEKKLIKNKKTFVLLLDKLDAENKIMAGTYIFIKGTSPLKVMYKLLAD